MPNDIPRIKAVAWAARSIPMLNAEWMPPAEVPLGVNAGALWSMSITYHFPDIRRSTRGCTGGSGPSWRRAKEYATALILEQRGGRQPAGLDSVAMLVQFTLPTRRRMDWQSLYGRIKAYEDALVDTGELTDDNIGVVYQLTLEATYHKGESGVTITLTPV